MPRRKRTRALGYRRGGLPGISEEYRRAVLARKQQARRNCPLFQKRVADAIDNYMPSGRFQPAFFHRLTLAEGSASRGNCKRAYREIGDAKKFGRKFQRSEE